jgi:hypothetical protein
MKDIEVGGARSAYGRDKHAYEDYKTTSKTYAEVGR